jgi:hypothetical protein
MRHANEPQNALLGMNRVPYDRRSAIPAKGLRTAARRGMVEGSFQGFIKSGTGRHV